ncbi:hypothetical protein DP939_42010 [Spongiactinospora rosea]|uniref:Tetratricopeptide repeat protein n=1 Tax=Spongiactinospora rosea TaxID=2248750 RepID=A0A366LJU8_9ACTN|nr:hypothetical protein DP939_42010 [Spongiactinospora rosea]
MACAYQKAGDVGRAIPLFEETVTDCERVLSGDHPLIKKVREDLDSCL